MSQMVVRASQDPGTTVAYHPGEMTQWQDTGKKRPDRGLIWPVLGLE